MKKMSLELYKEMPPTYEDPLKFPLDSIVLPFIIHYGIFYTQSPHCTVEIKEFMIVTTFILILIVMIFIAWRKLELLNHLSFQINSRFKNLWTKF